MPLLELQPMQQSAMFASFISAMSFTMCSHDAQVVLGLGAILKARPQYTQWRSRAITADARSRGIFQRAAVWMRALLMTANVEIQRPPEAVRCNAGLDAWAMVRHNAT